MEHLQATVRQLRNEQRSCKAPPSSPLISNQHNRRPIFPPKLLKIGLPCEFR
jgi:hypothetical protein